MDFAINPLDGARIACRRTGPHPTPGLDPGPAIVMVHGTALSQVIWRGFGYVGEFSTDHAVVTLDLRGHGRSDKPHDESAYGMELFVADVLAVLDLFEIERAHYLGYSLGGRVGFSVADAYPQRIAGLISAAGAPRNEPGAFDRVFFPGCIGSLESGGMTGFLDGWQAYSGGELDRATRGGFLANDALALAAYMRRADSDTGVPDDRLAGFTLPTLMLVGSADVERLAAARHVQTALPAAQLRVIDGATHADLLRHPEARPTIRSFLAASGEIRS